MTASAPQARGADKKLAGGVSPRNQTPLSAEPQRGDRMPPPPNSFAPSGLCESGHRFRGLTPPANICRPVGPQRDMHPPRRPSGHARHMATHPLTPSARCVTTPRKRMMSP